MNWGFAHRSRLVAATALLVLGLLIPPLGQLIGGAGFSHANPAQSKPAVRLQHWSPAEAPLRNFYRLQFFDQLLVTGHSPGNCDLGPVPGMLELRLYLEPGSSSPAEWRLAWLPQEVTDPNQAAFCLSLEAFLNVHRLSGEVEPWQQGSRVVWRFPQPVQQVRINWPAQGRYKIAAWEAILASDPAQWTALAWQRRAARLATLILAVACWCLAAMILWPDSLSCRTLDAFILALTLASFLLTIFLLPPFQGPDEPDHWRDALMRYRRTVSQEPLLYYLPEITGFDRVRWRPDAHVSTTLFHRVTLENELIIEPKYVNYAGYHSYPMVAIIAWCFPQVETVSEALTFYYLCRIVPVLVLAGFLFWFWKRERYPALAAAVLSLPYAQQQCIVISTDTLANLAALAAGMIFVVLRRHWSWWAYAGLWLTAVLAFLAKPPIYIFLFLLPIVATPGRLWRGRIGLAGAAAAMTLLAALVVLLVWRGYRAMLDLPEANWFRQQLAFLLQEGGWQFFLRQPLPQALEIPTHLQNWCMPLGWVDTYFHPYHLGLLRMLILAAAVTDVLRAALYFHHWLNRPALKQLLAVLLIGVALFLGTWILTAVIMYLVVTPPRYPFIYGMQVRYLFPCLLAWIWLPLVGRSSQPQRVPNGSTSCPAERNPVMAQATGCDRDSPGSSETACSPASETPQISASFTATRTPHRWAWLDQHLRPGIERLVTAVWVATLLVLTASRLLGLTGDLLARYW